MYLGPGSLERLQQDMDSVVFTPLIWGDFVGGVKV